MSSPTEKTMIHLRRNGYKPAVVEKWNAYAKRDGKGPPGIRVDLFGCIDIVAIRADKPGVLGIQATSRGEMGKRLDKIKEIPEAALWLACANRLEIWGWDKKGSRLRLKRLPVTLADFGEP